MFVHARFRRGGIGRALVQALLAHCSLQGPTAVELWTARDGSGAALYRACGFRSVPAPSVQPTSDPERYQPGAGEVWMRHAQTYRGERID